MVDLYRMIYFRGGYNWLSMEVGRGVASGELLLNVSKATSVSSTISSQCLTK